MVKCPPNYSLENFLNDALTESEREAFAVHIEGCPQCQESLRSITQQMPLSIRPHLLSALSESNHAPGCGDEKLEFLKELAQNLSAGQADPFRVEKSNSTENKYPPNLDNYEILEELGRGAVGVVYRARHRELDRLVAIKMVSSQLELSRSAQQRFRQEAQAIARLRHPNIVQVYEIGQHNGCPYFSLELVEGDNLARWLGGIPRRALEAAHIIEVLSRAIDYAHSRGIIHRDLKPANVLLGTTAKRLQEPKATNVHVDFEFELKITDFGLAKFLPGAGIIDDQLTQSGMIVGTPAYVAPEQARGEVNEVGPAADIYSLGVILYELLTGRPPFHGSTPIETLLLAAHREPVALTRLAQILLVTCRRFA